MGSVWNSGVLGGLPTAFNESVQGGQEEIPTSFNETVQGGRETRHLEQSTSQVVGAQEVDHRYDVDGLLFQDSWLIGDNISVRYAIRYKKSDPSKAEVELGDVFIDLDDFRNLISIYQDEGMDEAMVPSVWTINVKDRKLRFCPLAEFVYQAAVFSNGGALSSQVFRGILELLLVNLLPDNPISNALISFKEINTLNTKNANSVLNSGNKTQQTRQKKKLLKSCRKRKLSAEDSSDVIVQPIKERIGAEVVIKYEDECEISDNSLDANNESMLNDEAGFSSEEEIQTKERNNLNQTFSKCSKARSRYQCAICESSFKKESTLYLHQVNKHPNNADLHIAKPTSLGNRVTRTTTECKVCGVELRGLTKEYKHYETSHPDFADRPSKPDYLVNKEIAKGDKARKETEATCRECFKEFATTKHLFNHCRREHPDQPEICPLEPIRLGPISSLHERACDQGDNGDQFKCGEPTCSLHFQRFLSLVDHERTGHPSCYICILCGLPCLSADSLISHSDNIHPKKSTFICRVCGFFNRNTRGLTIHTQQEHMKGTLTYQCEKCAYTSENYVTFGNHRRTAHLEDNSKFVCEECGNNFASKQSLSSHRRLHNPDFKKFECKYCPQKFGHSSVLLIHMRVHTGEKPFCCNICGATFGSQTASTRHRRVVHAGDSEMRFQCPDCGKKYPSRAKRDFENHCKTHSGVRDHVCDLCGSAYFSKKGLRKHERAAHPAQKPMKPKPFKISGDEAMAPTGPPETALLQPPSYEPRSHISLDRGEDPHGTGGHMTREDFLPGHVTRTNLDHHGHMQHQHLLQASRDGVLPAHQIDREVLSGPRAGDMNLQLAYAAALNRQQGDNRITQFFVPNTQAN